MTTPKAPPPPPPAASTAPPRRPAAKRKKAPEPQPRAKRAPAPAVTRDPFWNRFGWKHPGLFNGLAAEGLGLLLFLLNVWSISRSGVYGVKSMVIAGTAMGMGFAISAWPYGNAGPDLEQTIAYFGAAAVGALAGFVWLPTLAAWLVL